MEGIPKETDRTMARLKSEQARSLWTRTVLRYLAVLIAFTLAYAGFGILFGEAFTARIGDWFADSTSNWNYMAIDDFRNMWSYGLVDIDHLQLLEVEGTDMIAFRDLSVYRAFKDLKVVFIALGYVFFAALITVFFLRRPIKLIDRITLAIASPDLPKGATPHLPETLGPLQTELELLQARIAQSELAARDAEERKNELVTYLAHDIRTPLTSVLGYLELICDAEGLDPDKQRTFAGAALSKAERLESLVEELFEITRYNMQTIPIERESLDMELLCQQIAEEFYPQARAKDITIAVEAQEGIVAFLDSARIGRALENIMRNAIVHADRGSTIILRAHAEKGTLVLSITDRGKEIAPEHLSHIFERFYRGDPSRSQESGGAGLGLAIAKEIVEAHGGTIRATSELGTATFGINVPQSVFPTGSADSERGDQASLTL